MRRSTKTSPATCIEDRMEDELRRLVVLMRLGWFTNGRENEVTGAFATHGWVDPEKKMTIIFMVQNVLVPKSSEPRDKFCELAVGSVGAAK